MGGGGGGVGWRGVKKGLSRDVVKHLNYVSIGGWGRREGRGR